MKDILIALAVGVGIGILIAPDKGSETLQKIKDQLDDLLAQASEKGKHLYKEGKSKVSGAADDIKHAAKRFE
ncbi:MAG TPA: YtxH domain-containing protein [Flavitalea sp.]|nr:YtxH domain-containing protein [Flavitalea sp.]